MNNQEIASELMSVLENSVQKLFQGGLVIFPTETFYGLGARVSDHHAISRLAALKGRVTSKPMPVIVADEASARTLWSDVPAQAKLLIHRFWPGPLTLVLPARSGLPFEVAPAGEIGIRVSSHPIARELARRVGPLVATSANLSGSQESTRVSQIDRTLVKTVDAIIDAGETPGGRPSTVVGFSEGELVIFREGVIQRALIDACKI